MKILLATPLYPPDIAEPAPYVKELAIRLSKSHVVAVLSYNHIPETIDGVEFVTVEKQLPLFNRLFTYTRALYKASKHADVIYVQNGPSTELPMILVSILRRKPFILRLGDETALTHAKQSFFYHVLLSIAVQHARVSITHEKTTAEKYITLDRPTVRPEILPFSEYPAAAFTTYESSWNKHVEELTKIFSS